MTCISDGEVLEGGSAEAHAPHHLPVCHPLQLKKRCKVAEARATQASFEMTEARLKCHELELLASHLPDITGMRDSAGTPGIAQRPSGSGQPLGSSIGMGGALELGGMAAQIAELRSRQQGYLNGRAGASAAAAAQ